MAENEYKPDRARRERVGLAEAVLCGSKSTGQIEHILADAHERGTTLLLTRLDPVQLQALAAPWRERLDFEPLSRTAILGELPALREDTARVAIVTAGTSDVGVAREAARTLRHAGHPAREFHDIGVAGLWRVLERVDEIAALPVVIVAAGMDAALPSVLGGLVGGAIIAVPTSTGYGVATGGHTALHAMLASCAPGITVVNIDNGYGAACAALRILRGTATPRL